MAVRALRSGDGYEKEEHDEFCQLNVFHGDMTQANDHWTYPLIRCGAFDYRESIEERRNNPYLFTAAVAEPIALKEGMLLYSTPVQGVPISLASQSVKASSTTLHLVKSNLMVRILSHLSKCLETA